MPPVHLTEARSRATTSPLTGSRMLVQLISPGWGSSGYYSAETLADAAEARVWPAGTHLYLDHPTATEDAERPERSVRDLAGVLTEDARIGEGGALVAEARVYGPMRSLLAEMADDIGLSIRATAEVSDGEVEGRRGTIISRLVEGLSVDFVTKAGRGGKVLEVLESARTVTEKRNVGQWIESRLHLALTELGDELYGDGRMSRAERIALSSAVGDALDAFTTRVEADAPELYQRDLWDDPPNPDYGQPPGSQEVDETSKPADTPPAQPITENGGAMPPENKDGGKVTETTGRPVSEAERLQRLLEESQAAHGRALTRAEEAEKRATAAERRATLLEARWAAETRTKTALAASPLKEASWPAVIATVADGLALDDNGRVDEARIDEAITAAIDAERQRVAALLEAHGVGVPRDLGGSPDTDTLTESDFEAQLAAELGDIGLTETAAQLAAKGRA
jgi:hypothetical protein